MRKRRMIILLVVIATILAGSSLYYFLVIKPQRNTHTPVINAMPDNVLFFFKGINFPAFYNSFYEKGFWKDLANNPAIHQIDRQIKSLDSLISKNKNISDYLATNEIILGVHKTSMTGVDILALLQTKKTIGYSDIARLVKTGKRYMLVKRKFQDVEIWDYQLTPQKSLVAFAIKDRILMLSPNALLVEDAIKTLLKNRNKEILLAKYCKPVSRENIFVNFSQLNSFMELFISPANKELVSGLKNFAGLGKYEADFSKDYIYLRGDLLVDDSNSDFISMFHSQKPMSCGIQKIIPDRTAVLISYNLENYPRFYRKYTDHLKMTHKFSFYQTDVRQFEDRYHLSLSNNIIPLLEGHFALVINEPVTNDLNNCSSVIIKVTDTEKAIRLFQQYDEASFSNDSSAKNFKTQYKDVKIYKSNISESFGLLFGKIFGRIKQSYFVNIRDYLIFSSNLSNLKRFINDYQNEMVLNNSPDYNKFSEKIITETNLMVYIHPMRAVKIPDIFADTSFLKNMHNNIGYFENFNFFTFNLANNNNSFYSEIIVNYSSSKKTNKENLWAAELEGTVDSKPLVVWNTSTNSNDIIVFDKNNNLYSISATGSINWKKSIDSKPVGDILTIDLFNNKKTQYLFTTATHVYIFDRLGKNAGSYPVILKNAALTGICLISDKDESRYFIGCDNNTIYGFEKTGKTLSNWNPKKIKGNLLYPPKSFSKGNKNYVFAATDKGVFYLWDMRGREVFKPVELKTNFNNPFYMVFGKNEETTYMISADTTGSTYFINLKGTVEIQKLGKWSNEVIFMIADFNNDGQKELIYIDGSDVAAYSPEGRVLYSLKLECPALSFPEVINIKGRNYLLYRNKEMDKVYLADANGISVKNFPFPSNTDCLFYDINKDNVMEIIRGEGNVLYLSRY